ncbi:MAG: hypothetical protein ACREJC_11800, partial [Tepidisphaeraceae bacterium]
VISIDDDNFYRPADPFFTEHAVVAADHVTAMCVNSSDSWFNICRLLETQPSNVYPRGFPYSRRHQASELSQTTETSRVRINAGLWLGEPDLDAMTWLVSPARSTRPRSSSVVLGDRAWSPINTQNTALHREVIVSYYFAKMGQPLPGVGSIDRYGDILSGYFAQACVRYRGDRIRVGTPLVDHRRNAHNYLRDATAEMGCVWLMEDLCPWLLNLKLQGASYSEAYLSLAGALDDAAGKFTGFIWTDALRAYVHDLAHCMRRWTGACASLA